MADRTNCSLTIYGRMTKDQYDAFKSVCDDVGFYSGGGNWEFEEVAYGEMPSEIYAALQGLNIGYEWDVGSDYGIAPQKVCRLENGREVTLPTCNDEIMVPLDQLGNAEVIADAKAVSDMIATGTFKIIGDTSVTLSYREHATMLAALRYYQNDLLEDPNWLHGDIATDGGTLEPLTVEEIDTLCERINS